MARHHRSHRTREKKNLSPFDTTPQLRRKAKEAARTRDRQAAASQNEAEENDATEEEMTRERTTRVGRPRGGMKVAARIGERLRTEIGRGGRPRVGDG